MISKNAMQSQPNNTISKLKLVTIVGTRPEIIKLSEVIKKCDRYFEHKLVHTGQNYDYTLNQVFFDDLGLREPDFYLDVATGSNNLGETMGEVIAKSYNLLVDLKPDAILILGDTNSALSAISAKRLKIPIFHMEAGNRCFDQNVPEEINRKIVDHISEVNLAYTEHSRRYLINEGIKPEYSMVTGSPMTEVLEANKDKIAASTILNKLKLASNEYFLLSTHREENVDSEYAFNKLINSINNIADHYNKPIIFSVHPRTKAWLDLRKPKLSDLIILSKPFGILDYIKLQQHAFCVISDSGTLSEESSIVCFPAILVRTATERPESLDTGGLLVAGLEPTNIINSIDMVVDNFAKERIYRKPDSYLDANVSSKVVKIIQGYTDIVNHYIWRKPSKQYLNVSDNIDNTESETQEII